MVNLAFRKLGTTREKKRLRLQSKYWNMLIEVRNPSFRRLQIPILSILKSVYAGHKL